MIPHAVIDEREETVGDNVAKETKFSSQDKARVTSELSFEAKTITYFIPLQKMRVAWWLINIIFYY